MNTREFRPRVPGARFSLSCVVPVLNEGAQIERFLESLHQAIDQLADVEIVVVNDGSTDNSADEIAKLCGRLPLRYLELSRNFGKEMAIQAGLDVASGDCIVILDADFQHPISIIPSMIDRWRAGVDMVYAVKADRKSEGWQVDDLIIDSAPSGLRARERSFRCHPLSFEDFGAMLPGGVDGGSVVTDAVYGAREGGDGRRVRCLPERSRIPSGSSHLGLSRKTQC